MSPIVIFIDNQERHNKLSIPIRGFSTLYPCIALHVVVGIARTYRVQHGMLQIPEMLSPLPRFYQYLETKNKQINALVPPRCLWYSSWMLLSICSTV